MWPYDIDANGCHFTWSNNNINLGSRIWCKLDRVMGNADWFAQFPEASATFHPPRISDHCSVVRTTRKSNNMYLFQATLKEMKLMMKRDFHKVTKGIDDRVEKLRLELIEAQRDSEQDNNNVSRILLEQKLAREYRKVKDYQFLFYQQRAKMRWLNEGDVNTKFFHNVLKGRRSKNHIKFVKCQDGSLSSDPQVIKI
ncbi:unnamed protein product [Rhodiola kirilowii]